MHLNTKMTPQSNTMFFHCWITFYGEKVCIQRTVRDACSGRVEIESSSSAAVLHFTKYSVKVRSLKRGD